MAVSVFVFEEVLELRDMLGNETEYEVIEREGAD